MLLFIPLLCCLVNMLQKSRMRRGQSTAPTETETWLLRSGIQDSYKAISRKTMEWTKTPAPPRSDAPQVKTLADRKGAASNIWVLETSTPPRLLRYTNVKEGEATFELNEHEGGGTSIRVIFSYGAASKIQTLKSEISAEETTPDAEDKRCENCSKSLLKEFEFCPYCGYKQGGG